MLLYHGSKSGIQGNIRPISREKCDFGSGFYMGDISDQPKGLIAPYPGNRFYGLEYNKDGLQEKIFGDDYISQLDWALYVAFNREPEVMMPYKNLCAKYKRYNESNDIIIGLIADDKMTQVMNLFFKGFMCDKAFIEALQYVKLGRQYVLKTGKACEEERFQIINEHKLSAEEIKLISAQNANRTIQLNNLINRIQTKYRRAQNVKFFDEIIEEWNK